MDQNKSSSSACESIIKLMYDPEISQVGARTVTCLTRKSWVTSPPPADLVAGVSTIWVIKQTPSFYLLVAGQEGNLYLMFLTSFPLPLFPKNAWDTPSPAISTSSYNQHRSTRKNMFSASRSSVAQLQETLVSWDKALSNSNDGSAHYTQSYNGPTFKSYGGCTPRWAFISSRVYFRCFLSDFNPEATPDTMLQTRTSISEIIPQLTPCRSQCQSVRLW